MKRFWFGIAVLAVLLGLCLWAAGAMEEIHKPIAEQLSLASEAAMDGDWSRAEVLATQAYTAWKHSWRATASVADHSPMDEVDGLFAQLPIYVREEESTHFAATCAQLSQLVEAMHDAHAFNWWNLL